MVVVAVELLLWWGRVAPLALRGERWCAAVDRRNGPKGAQRQNSDTLRGATPCVTIDGQTLLAVVVVGRQRHP